jgi:hypothetical protein
MFIDIIDVGIGAIDQVLADFGNRSGYTGGLADQNCVIGNPFFRRGRHCRICKQQRGKQCAPIFDHESFLGCSDSIFASAEIDDKWYLLHHSN